MKKIILSALLALAATGAWAQYRESYDLLRRLVWNDEKLNIMLDTRFDFSGSSGNDAEKQLGFHTQTLKLWVVGEIVPGIRYRVRQRLNKAQGSERDGLSGATDHAWISFNFGREDRWTIIAGKQSVQFGTFEYDYNAADIYLGTMIYDDLDSYKAGVDAVYSFLGQAVHLQVVNSDSPQFASPEWSDRALAGVVLWEGNFLGDVLKTRSGYGLFQHNEDKFYSWVTAGLQINASPFTAELDYYNGYRQMDYSSVVGGYAPLPPGESVPEGDDPSLRYVKDQSVSANLKLSLGKWHPFIKGVWSDRYDKWLGSDAYRTLGIQAVCEFYPFSRERLRDLRFHLAYMYSQTDCKGAYAGMGNQGTHTALAGMRWLFKAK